MTGFLVVVGILTAAGMLFVLWPLVRQRAMARGVTPGRANLAVYRDQLAELESDLRSGTLGTEQYEQSRRELERRVVDEVTAGSDPQPGPAAGMRWLPLALCLAIPAAAVAIYLALGTPQAVPSRPENGGDVQPDRNRARPPRATAP